MRNSDCCLIDPCVKYTELYDENGLYSAGLSISMDQVTCQSRLEADWYRFISPAGEDMSTICVEPFHCRTRFPIWLLGEYMLYELLLYISISRHAPECVELVYHKTSLFV